ncbi:MAG: hypothetical protein GXP56_01940 [Deltaproteobacteria bacterium]|nr:hypothetical protein [Deltaproteobacteria bacterium]
MLAIINWANSILSFGGIFNASSNKFYSIILILNWSFIYLISQMILDNFPRVKNYMQNPANGESLKSFSIMQKKNQGLPLRPSIMDATLAINPGRI